MSFPHPICRHWGLRVYEHVLKCDACKYKDTNYVALVHHLPVDTIMPPCQCVRVLLRCPRRRGGRAVRGRGIQRYRQVQDGWEDEHEEPLEPEVELPIQPEVSYISNLKRALINRLIVYFMSLVHVLISYL